ncbi:hypothetical protein, partial [Nocardia abscessus]|uniref:hypothetical protein n=1 Tax=Nocardia abscessus TaxID=120957 RepID=UPI001E5B2AFA
NLRDPGGLRGNKRGDELGKVHIAGGGFTPGPHGDDEPEPTPSLRSGSAQTTRPDTPTVDPAVIKNCAIQLARVFRALALSEDNS